MYLIAVCTVRDGGEKGKTVKERERGERGSIIHMYMYVYTLSTRKRLVIHTCMQNICTSELPLIEAGWIVGCAGSTVHSELDSW